MKNFYSFVGSDVGQWNVTSQNTITGSPLESVPRIEVINSPPNELTEQGVWALQGFTSNVRYANRNEIVKLQAAQEGLNRKESVVSQ
jgi:hypothetical protein